MASYLITGASRGIGFEFLNQLSKDSSNTVIGLVRNKEATVKKVHQELATRQNIHILEADVDDYKALKASVSLVSEITGGRLDYIIGNAAYISPWSAFDSLDVLGASPERLEEDLRASYKTNVIGNVHLFNLYMPLVLRGNAKKVIVITSGYADTANVAEGGLHEAMPYSVSKSAVNMVVAKYAAQYGKEGVLFLALSPGVVDTGKYSTLSEKELLQTQTLGMKFMKYYPHFQGPTTPEVSVKALLSVVDRASIEKGDNGAFLSHHGDKNWM